MIKRMFIMLIVVGVTLGGIFGFINYKERMIKQLMMSQGEPPQTVSTITAGFLVLLGVKRMRVVPIETLEVMDELSMLEPPVPRARRKPRPASTRPLSPWR